MLNIVILANDLDDCLLYVDGVAYSDIDYRDAMGILLLKDIKELPLNIELRVFDGDRIDFPDSLEDL